MISFIILFFPTFITLFIENKRNKLTKEDILFKYPIYNLTINFICLLITYIYKYEELIIIHDNFNILNFCVKYSIIAIILSILLPFIKEFIIKNFNIEVEIRREKNKK